MTARPDIAAAQAQGMPTFRPDGKQLRAYLRDTAHVSVIRGPIGSGTSSGSCQKLHKLGMEMPKWADGKRRSRFAVVRNTYAELRDTTLQTWLYWFPEERYGKLVRSRPLLHQMRWADVEMDVYFLALDDDADVRKLRSFEFTGFWINELEYLPKSLFDEMESRTGRFPPEAEVRGQPCWDGVIADMNAPGEEHWLPQMTGEVPYPEDVPADKRPMWPAAWSYFVQPPALVERFGEDRRTVVGYEENPASENRRNLRPGYHLQKAEGKSKEWIDSRLMNRIVTVVDGDPVWPMFVREQHAVGGTLMFNPGYPVEVALDFGRRPTAIFSQTINHRVQIQRELRMYGVGAATFAPEVKRFLAQHYPGATVRLTGDPKGQDRGQADERTAYDIFKALGMPVAPCPVKGNNIETRLEVVAYALQQFPMGHSRILISVAGCPTLVAGMAGKYHLKKVDGEAAPVKDKYSDPCDCLGYLLIYLGDGKEMIGLTAGRQSAPMRVAKPMKSLRRVS